MYKTTVWIYHLFKKPSVLHDQPKLTVLAKISCPRIYFISNQSQLHSSDEWHYNINSNWLQQQN